MMKNFIRRKIAAIMIFAFTLTLPVLAHAQADTHGGIPRVDADSKAYKNMVKIRRLINDSDYKGAERQSRRLIKSERRNFNKKTGLSDFYKGAYNSLCVSLTGLGKIDEGLSVCNQSLEYKPTNWESFKSRATLYYMTQDFQKSLDDFILSLEHAPDNQAIKDVLKQNIGIIKSKIK